MLLFLPALSINRLKGLNFITWKEKTAKKIKNSYQIVFPGRVDLARKEYTPYLQHLYHSKEILPYPLTLIFLGPIKGKREAKYLQQWNIRFSPGIQLVTFGDTISQEVYDSYLQQADLLILPLKQTVRFSVYREVLGKTKISGGIHDGLRYSTPTLVPDFYPIREEFKGVVMEFFQWWDEGDSPPINSDIITSQR